MSLVRTPVKFAGMKFRSSELRRQLAEEKTADGRRFSAVGNQCRPVRSTTVPQAVSQKIIELRDGINLGDCFLDVVFDSVKRNLVIVENDVGCAWIIISGLTDGSDIDKSFLLAQIILKIQFFGIEKTEAFCENSRHVCVPLKTVILNQRENLFHFSLVESVFGKNIFVEWIAGGTVDKKKFVHAECSRTFAEVFPAFFIFSVVSALELLARPENCTLRSGIETFRVEERSLVVISQQAHRAVIHDRIDTFTGIRAVSDHIAQAEDLRDILPSNVGQDGFQSLQIAVDVTDDRAQCRLPSPTGALSNEVRSVRSQTWLAEE